MQGLWRSRKAVIGGTATLGAVLALTLLVVLPAFASTIGQPILPPSASGITPTDNKISDNPGDCKTYYPGAGGPTYSFKIVDGTSKTYTDTKTGATFTLTVNPGNPDSKGTTWPAYAKNTYFSFTSTGAAIVDVGVDGDNEKESARYAYGSQGAGSVTSDGYLHAAAAQTNTNGTPKKLDPLDDMVFCYNVVAPVKGTVYQDSNQNGQDDSEPANQSWSVKLYHGASVVSSTTTDSTGAYTVLAPVPGTYTVCESPSTADAASLWVQSQPGPTDTTTCSGTGELPKGIGVSVANTTPITGQNFGNVTGPGVVACDPNNSSPEPNYAVTINCSGKGALVFGASQSTDPKAFVSLWANSGSPAPLIEKIVFPDAITNGTPAYNGIVYTDTFPFDTTKLKPMRYCQLDPRDSSGALASAYTNISSKGLVLPTGTDSDGTAATSCLIAGTVSTDSSGAGHFTGYVYTDVDGFRSTAG